MGKTISRKEILALLEAHIQRHAGGNARKWGDKNGFSQPFISLVRSGHKLPSQRLCAVLGYRPIVTQTITYEKLG